MFLEGRLPLGRLIDKRYALDDINAALEDLASGRVLRPLIDFALAKSA
jgi:Zn-dependent alcohol dehydrogenase